MPRSANSETPYLSLPRTHHEQMTLVLPEPSARVRKPSIGRSGRNPVVYDPPSPRGRGGETQGPPAGRPSLHSQLDADMPIPDFPPPSFQEAITTPVYHMQEVSMSETSFSSYYSIQRSPSVDSYPTTSASSPASQYEDAYEVDSTDTGHALPALSPSDVGSPAGNSPAEWEMERQQGIPLEERVQRERERQEQSEGTHISVDPPKSSSRPRACSHCGVSNKSPTDDRRKAETLPRRRGLLKHKHSQSLSSASVPSTPIRSRPRTSLKSTSSSKRKSRSMSPRPSLITPMSTSNSLSVMSRKLFAHSNKGKDKLAADEPLESWEVLETGPQPVPQVENPQPGPTSRVRRTLSRMSLSALATINTQTDTGRSGSIEPYPFEPPLPSATMEKSRLKQLDPPAPMQNLPSSLQHDRPPATPISPPVRSSSPLTTKRFSPSTDIPPPTPSTRMAASTPNMSPIRPVPLIDSRQTQTSPLISPVAMRLGVRQRVKSMSIHAGPPSSIVFPKVPIPADRRATTNSNLRKYASTTINPSSPLSVLSSFPGVPPINTHFGKSTQNRDFRISLSTIRPPSSPLEPGPPTPVRHHYPGRPLPVPPAGVPPSPSAYESLLLPRSTTPLRFPLTLNVPNATSDTMLTERSTATSSNLTYFTDRPTSPLSSVSGSSIIEMISEADGETVGSESLDLNVLIPRVDSNDGGKYQQSLSVSGVIKEDERPGTAGPHGRSDDSANVPLVGPVEVERRRELKDGRVKLKLRVMGISVEKCGICFMQFKEKEMGALTPKCWHSYHEKCLKTLLQRNSSCPSCRAPLNPL